MTITNSPNAIINWQNFSIGAQNTVNFQQQSAASKVLNRVVGTDPSSILGKLSSNGQVWLLNPNGVLFGQNARIDVAGLVASSLDVSNVDFLAGSFKFENLNPTSNTQVLNQGEINTTFGGRVWLLGGAARNEGLIQTPSGNIVLAAGKSIEIVDSGMPNVQVRITAPENTVVNLGQLIASDGGSVDVHGGIVNQQGVIRANSVGTDNAGRIIIKATGDVQLFQSSEISASAAGTGTGGSVTVESEASAMLIDGKIESISIGGKGGQINISGQDVYLQTSPSTNANIDASGSTGGGSITVAGGSVLKEDYSAFLGRNSNLKANATQTGNGGRIVFTSGDVTSVNGGSIEAKGGPEGGNGGFIETSGVNLDARPSAIDVNAPRGNAGKWLLGAAQITIGDINSEPSSHLESIVRSPDINNALDKGTEVIIRATDPMLGDILVNSNIKSASSGSLTLEANRNIILSQSVKIQSTLLPMPVTLTSDAEGNGIGKIEIGSSASINTSGGAIVLQGGGPTGRAIGSPAGVKLQSDSNLDAGGGSTNITIKGGGLGPGDVGVYLDRARLNAGTINIDGASAGDLTLGDSSSVIFSGANIYGGHISVTGSSVPNSYHDIQIINNTKLTGNAENGGLSIIGRKIEIGYGADINSGAAPSIFSADESIELFSKTSAPTKIGDSNNYGNINFLTPNIFGFSMINSSFDVKSQIITKGEILVANQSGDVNVNFNYLDFSGNKLLIQGNDVNLSGVGRMSSPVQIISNSKTKFSPDLLLQSLSSGDSIIIKTTTFDNRSNNSIYTPNGRWLIYSKNPNNDIVGILNYDFVQYNAPYAATPALSSNGLLYSDTLNIQQSISRPYDATSRAVFTSGSTQVTGLPSGYEIGDANSSIPGFSFIGDFNDKNVGLKQVTMAATTKERLFDGASKPIYGANFSYSGEITQKEVIVGLVGAVSRDYDATVNANLNNSMFVVQGKVAGDDVSVSAPLQGTFDNFHVGKQKVISTNGVEITGADSGNYLLTSHTASGNIGEINPALLSYTAAATIRTFGRQIEGFTGSVLGFKGGDNISTSTNGELAWITPASISSQPGTYFINGSGLTAADYIFVQATGNATALTLVPSNNPSAPQVIAQNSGVSSGNQAIQLATVVANKAGVGNLIDSTPLNGRTSFGSIKISSMSQEQLSALLDFRKKFKTKLFADAIYKLDIDPSLANVQPCPSLAEINSGKCLITPDQIEKLDVIKSKIENLKKTEKTEKVKLFNLPKIEKKIAVFIGINEYEDKKIPQLDNAVSDADAVAKLFAERLGYEARIIKNPGKNEIIKALNSLSTEVGSNDSVVIYYAGHGYAMEKNGTGYWIPADAPVTDPSRWISNTDVSKILAGIRSKQMVLISDSCYSGAFAAEGSDTLGRNVKADEVLTKRSVVVLSSGSDEPVSDEGKDGHSIFAWHLMKSVNSVQNWQPGSTIFTEVRQGVKKEFPQTPKYGAMTSAGHQTGGEYLFEFRPKDDSTQNAKPMQ
jgi:filamentous hemagglutinin family protein